MSPVISRSISTDLGLNCLLGFLTDHVWSSLAAVTAAGLMRDRGVIVACGQTLIVSQRSPTTDSARWWEALSSQEPMLTLHSRDFKADVPEVTQVMGVILCFMYVCLHSSMDGFGLKKKFVQPYWSVNIPLIPTTVKPTSVVGVHWIWSESGLLILRPKMTLKTRFPHDEWVLTKSGQQKKKKRKNQVPRQFPIINPASSCTFAATNLPGLTNQILSY